MTIRSSTSSPLDRKWKLHDLTAPSIATHYSPLTSLVKPLPLVTPWLVWETILRKATHAMVSARSQGRRRGLSEWYTSTRKDCGAGRIRDSWGVYSGVGGSDLDKCAWRNR
jgi:hypothetical protein